MHLISVRYVLLILLLLSCGSLFAEAQVTNQVSSTEQKVNVDEAAAEQEVTRLAMNDTESVRPVEKTGIAESVPVLLVPLVLVVLALVAVSRRKEQEK